MIQHHKIQTLLGIFSMRLNSFPIIKTAFKIVFILANVSLCLVHIQVAGQAIRNISSKDGLPQSFVSGLEQDKAGFVWVGSRNGLARYDGINFKVFQHSNQDTSSLVSNLIINIKGFNKGIWIEHESGEIDELDPVSEKIKHHHTPLLTSGTFFRRAWIVDSNGTIWRIIDGKGLARFGPTPKLYTKTSGGFDSDTLWGICEGVDNRIWVLTRFGLSSLDQQSGKISNYSSPQVLDYHDYRNAVRFAIGLHQRRNGELMWADRNYLYIFSVSQKKFLKKIPFGSHSDRGVTWIRTGPDGSEYLERGIAIYRYDELTGLKLIYGQTKVDKNPIQSFLVDKSGLIWLGTNAYGITQVDLTTPFFPSFPLKDGFAGDVLEAEFHQSLSSLFDWGPKDQRFAAPGYHLRSAYDKSGTLWIGLKDHVVRYQSATKSFISLPKITQISNAAETGIGIKGLTISPQGLPVVIGYNRNVLIYNPPKNTWDWLIPAGQISRQLGTDITPQDISMDTDRIWITTERDGLILIDRKTGKINQLKQGPGSAAFPTNHLLGLRPDPSRPSLLWIGSRDGLICLNKKTLKTEIFNTSTGLPDNTIYTLLADHYGKLWFGTNKGLCSFSPITHKVRLFQTRHGLLEDEFNRFHQLMLPDGRLAFGGTQGWTLFDPNKIKDDAYQPAIALTALKINNETVTPTTDGLLTQPVNAIGELILPYDQNTVTFFFAGLQFNQPLDLNYRYQLEGYDSDWIGSGQIPFAIYTKIPPGSYKFLVNASNTTGQWSKDIKKLTIRVRPPWWQTWWAYMAYALVIGGSIWYWMRLQVIRMELSKSIELKKQEAQQLHVLAEMKERFFTNVTHDFRTPLTLILSPLTSLIEKFTGTNEEKTLLLIKRNAEQLLALINQLLDFSKLDANMLTIEESIGDPGLVTENTLHLFREEAARKGVTISFTNQLHGQFWFDAPKLERVLGNLIGNALKFTPSGGLIRVTVRNENDHVLFSVSDTGIGIPEDQTAYIFKRYFQIGHHKDQAVKGTGIGLSLVKEMVQLQEGRIELESKLGQGSTFRILLPYRPATPSAIPSLNTGVTEKWDVPVIQNETIRILLIEDNPELSDFIAGSLPERYIVERATNGADGLKIALETLPDLIISDVMMPVMDGFELCKAVKQHEHTSHIPVILLTAKTAVESRMQGLVTGADDYLTKPFRVPELNLRVYNLLDRQRRLRTHLQSQISSPPSEQGNERELDPFLVRFYGVIEQDLDNSSVGVEELAACMNMSRSQLHRKLRAIAGLPVSDVVRNYRLTKVAAFLKEGVSSSECAYKVGFDSPAYFTKCFREFYGLTPSEFQKR
ncbi:hybrid sensor histidine kinase/response regulator transcription factor [Larkinella sp. C7]|jgi:signal transduction histidine kinase/DNA-binding NarL/FixJ family response regulator/streptogramin lyase|uniref:hybrid sensor histidine kinase/response regulator transcription factor n=1 Tax=Larkinella sp. C7 TaxID=2576607 RepID=UPI0011110DA3|nr:hybrid sensor histidine kinase/response regulator transcription factor [Larkinella sp. C7]